MTSLQLPFLFRRHPVTVPRAINTQTIEHEEIVTMKMMIIGAVLAIAGASAEMVTNPEHMTQREQMFASFIFGSISMLVVIGLHGVKSAQQTAMHACSAIPMAGMCSPAACWFIAKSLAIEEVSLTMLGPVALAIGLIGPSLVVKYGDKFVDILASYGFANARATFGVHDGQTIPNVKQDDPRKD